MATGFRVPGYSLGRRTIEDAIVGGTESTFPVVAETVAAIVDERRRELRSAAAAHNSSANSSLPYVEATDGRLLQAFSWGGGVFQPASSGAIRRSDAVAIFRAASQSRYGPPPSDAVPWFALYSDERRHTLAVWVIERPAASTHFEFARGDVLTVVYADSVTFAFDLTAAGAIPS